MRRRDIHMEKRECKGGWLDKEEEEAEDENGDEEIVYGRIWRRWG